MQKESVFAPDLNGNQLGWDLRVKPIKVKKKSVSLTGKRINLHLKRHPKIISPELAVKASFNARENTALFYTLLYRELFDNSLIVHPPSRTFTLGPEKEDIRYFRPDLESRDLQGKTSIEVKSVCANNGSFPCKVEQLEGYTASLLKQKNLGDLSPTFNYALFTYGDSHKNYGFHNHSAHQTVKTLSKLTNSLLVLPPNIVYLLEILSRRETFASQDSKKDRIYSMFKRSIVTSFTRYDEPDIKTFLKDYEHQATISLKIIKSRRGIVAGEKEILESRLEKAHQFAESKSAGLDNLVLRKIPVERFPEMVYSFRGNDYQIQPFPITIYSLKDQVGFVDNLVRNQNYILDKAKLKNWFKISEEYKEQKRKEAKDIKASGNDPWA